MFPISLFMRKQFYVYTCDDNSIFIQLNCYYVKTKKRSKHPAIRAWF